MADPFGGGQFPAEEGQLNDANAEPMNAASAAAVQNLLAQVARSSAFNRVQAPMPGPSYTDLMAQALQAQAQPHLVQLLAQANGLNFLGMPQHLMQMPPQEAPPLPSGRGRRTQSGGDGRTVTNNNSYASRHQQAEARRRSRINERLDALRKIVPHTERANTAAFLEDVVRYVQRLQHRVLELELKLGLPPTVTPPAAPITFGDSATPEGTLVTTNSQGGIDRLALQAVLQQAAATVAAMPQSEPVAAGPVTAATAPPRMAIPSLNNAPVLPSVSEELAMAAQLAPPLKNESAAERATMAESQPPAAAAAAAAAMAATAPTADDNGGGKRHQVPIQQDPAAIEHPTKRRKGTERK